MDFFATDRILHHTETTPFLDWMRTDVERSKYVQLAQGILQDGQHIVPSLQYALRAPQGGPDHLEGVFVHAHVLRMLTALCAIQDGVSLARIEEFVSYAHLKVDLDLIACLIKEQFATFAVFALLHDVKKHTCVRIAGVSHPTSTMATLELRLRQNAVLQHQDILLYDKLYKAIRVELGDVREEESMLVLYERYGIRFTYPSHERWFVNDQSAEEYISLFTHHRLQPRDVQHVKFLTRYHDMVHEASGTRGGATLELLRHAAEAYGIDGSDARDMLLVTLFLNDICGKIVYRDGIPVAQTELLYGFVTSEDMQFHADRLQKQEKLHVRRRTKVKIALQEVGLSIEALLALFEIPFDDSRDEFVSALYKYFFDSTTAVPSLFRRAPHATQEQLRLAKQYFDEYA